MRSTWLILFLWTVVDGGGKEWDQEDRAAKPIDSIPPEPDIYMRYERLYPEEFQIYRTIGISRGDRIRRCTPVGDIFKSRWDFFMMDYNTLVIYAHNHTYGKYECVGFHNSRQFNTEEGRKWPTRAVVQYFNFNDDPNTRSFPCRNYSGHFHLLRAEGMQSVQVPYPSCDRMGITSLSPRAYGRVEIREYHSNEYVHWVALLEDTICREGTQPWEVEPPIRPRRMRVPFRDGVHAQKTIDVQALDSSFGNTRYVHPVDLDAGKRAQRGMWYIATVVDFEHEIQRYGPFFFKSYKGVIMDIDFRLPHMPNDISIGLVTPTSFVVYFSPVIADADYLGIAGYEIRVDKYNEGVRIYDERIPIERLQTYMNKIEVPILNLEPRTLYNVSVRCYDKYYPCMRFATATATTERAFPDYLYQSQTVQLLSDPHASRYATLSDAHLNEVDKCGLVTDEAITFGWNFTGATGYNVEFSKNDVLVERISTNSLSHTFDKLTPDTEYSVLVQSKPETRGVLLKCRTLKNTRKLELLEIEDLNFKIQNKKDEIEDLNYALKRQEKRLERLKAIAEERRQRQQRRQKQEVTQEKEIDKYTAIEEREKMKNVILVVEIVVIVFCILIYIKRMMSERKEDSITEVVGKPQSSTKKSERRSSKQK